jgi:hypothetical protein
MQPAKTLIILTLLLLPLHSIGKTLVGDRLLLEIGRVAYPQSYLEAYMVLKGVLGKHLKNKAQAAVPALSDWQQALPYFKREMLISREAKRLGRFYPTPTAIREVMDDVEIQRLQDRDFSNVLLRLNLNRSQLVKFVAEVLQVDEFARNKNQTGQDSWYEELEKQYIVRFFQNAETYVPIQPRIDNPFRDVR